MFPLKQLIVQNQVFSRTVEHTRTWNNAKINTKKNINKRRNCLSARAKQDTVNNDRKHTNMEQCKTKLMENSVQM